MNKIIRIITKMIDGVTGPSRKIDKSLQNTARQQAVLEKLSRRLHLSQRRLNKIITDAGLTLARNGVFYDNLTRKIVKQDHAIKRLHKKTRSFRFEFLGVMFAGMALYRVFGGLIKRQLDLFGITDLLSTVWTIVLLPIIESLLPWILKLSEKIMNLPKGVRMAIGVFVLFAAIIGAVLFVVGQIVLGLASLKLAFGAKGLIGVVKSAGAIFSWFGGAALGVIALILVAIIGIYLAWKDNFMNIRGIIKNFIDGVKQFFGGLKDFFGGFLDILVGLFTGDSKKLIEGLKRMVFGVRNMVFGFFKTLVFGVSALVIGIVKVVWNVIKSVFGIFVWLYDKLIGHSIIPDLINGIISWFFKLPSKIIGAFKNLATRIADTFRKILPNWMVNLLKKGINVASGIGGFVGGVLGSFQTGGVVPQTGPYLLHKGETVVPTRQGNSPINITVNANVASDIDIRELAKKLNRYISSEFQRNYFGGAI